MTKEEGHFHVAETRDAIIRNPVMVVSCRSRGVEMHKGKYKTDRPLVVLTCRDDGRHQAVGTAGRRRPISIQQRLLAQHHGLRRGAVQAADGPAQTVQVGAAVGAAVEGGGGGAIVQPQGVRVQVSAKRGCACTWARVCDMRDRSSTIDNDLQHLACGSSKCRYRPQLAGMP